MNPTVSVIIPVLNRESLIERTLNSVMSQGYRPLDLIIVDNGSTDSTQDVLKSWKSKHEIDGYFEVKILTENTIGACAARQKGLNNAKGEYIIFFDSDDEMLPSLIENGMLAFNENQDADIVCWKCEIIGLDGDRRVPPFDPKHPMENHLIHTLLRPQGYLIRRELIEKVGSWKKPLKVWNDLELGFRLLMEKPHLIGLKKVLAVIHSQKESITGINFSSKEGEWEKSIDEIRKENSKDNNPEKFLVEKILRYREVILASHYAKEGNIPSSRKLMKKALSGIPTTQKLILKFAYHYTRMGGRGAWRIIKPFYL